MGLQRHRIHDANYYRYEILLGHSHCNHQIRFDLPASPTRLARPTRCSSHLHHIAFDDDRPVFEQPVRSALHDHLDRDAIYRCDALIESNTTVPGLRHESQAPVLCGARQLGPSRATEPVPAAGFSVLCDAVFLIPLRVPTCGYNF